MVEPVKIFWSSSLTIVQNLVDVCHTEWTHVGGPKIGAFNVVRREDKHYTAEIDNAKTDRQWKYSNTRSTDMTIILWVLTASKNLFWRICTTQCTEYEECKRYVEFASPFSSYTVAHKQTALVLCTHYGDFGRNLKLFLPHVFNASLRNYRWNFVTALSTTDDAQNKRLKQFDDTYNHFDTKADRQTDRNVKSRLRCQHANARKKN